MPSNSGTRRRGILLSLGLARALGGEPEACVGGRPPLHGALLLEVEHRARELVSDVFVPARVFQAHLLRDLVQVHRGRGAPFGRGHLVSRPQELTTRVLRFPGHTRDPPLCRFPAFYSINILTRKGPLDAGDQLTVAVRAAQPNIVSAPSFLSHT